MSSSEEDAGEAVPRHSTAMKMPRKVPVKRPRSGSEGEEDEGPSAQDGGPQQGEEEEHEQGAKGAEGVEAAGVSGAGEGKEEGNEEKEAADEAAEEAPDGKDKRRKKRKKGKSKRSRKHKREMGGEDEGDDEDEEGADGQQGKRRKGPKTGVSRFLDIAAEVEDEEGNLVEEEEEEESEDVEAYEEEEEEDVEREAGMRSGRIYREKLGELVAAEAGASMQEYERKYAALDKAEEERLAHQVAAAQARKELEKLTEARRHKQQLTQAKEQKQQPQQQQQQQHQELQQQQRLQQVLDEEAAAADLVAEGGGYDVYEMEEDAMDTQSQVRRKMPLVGRDPKLYLVQCDPGKERAMVLALMQRFIQREIAAQHGKNVERLLIHSVFTTPASKGYVYVEADREALVKRAVYGLRALKHYRIQLVRHSEMTDALRVNVKTGLSALRPGQWVRINRGLYKNDLAQIVDLRDQNTNVLCKLLPRLDMPLLKAEIERERRRQDPGVPHSEDEASDENESSRQKRTRKKREFRRRYASRTRPLPRLFDVNEIRNLGGVVERRRGDRTVGAFDMHYDVFRSQRFSKGFLYKEFHVSALDTENVTPLPDELERFKQQIVNEDDKNDDDEDNEPDVLAMALADTISAPSHKVQFNKGDSVRVAEGDLRHLLGTVLSHVGDTVRIMPDHEDLTEPLEFTAHQLQKYFKVGDHVKVVAGPHKDETGLVVRVDDVQNTMTIFSDVSSAELVVSADQVVESTDITAARDTLGDFHLHDMVQIGPDQVGVIVKVETQAVRVLTHRGTVQTVRLSELGHKRTSRNAIALDVNQNQVTRDDVVRVIDGPHAGQTGTIRHIFRSTLFLHSRQMQQNSGIFVVQARQCVLVGLQTISYPGAAAGPKTPYSPFVGAGAVTPAIPASGPHPAAAAGGPRRTGGRTAIFNRFRDPLLHKLVTICRGRYKGMMGQVKAVTEQSLRVELRGQEKQISVPRAYVKQREEAAQVAGPARAAPLTPYLMGARTPAPLGARTPHVGTAKTPLVGSATPMIYPSTPSRMAPATAGSEDMAWSARTSYAPVTPMVASGGDSDVWSAKTPAHGFYDEEHEEEEQEEDLNVLAQRELADAGEPDMDLAHNTQPLATSTSAAVSSAPPATPSVIPRWLTTGVQALLGGQTVEILSAPAPSSNEVLVRYPSSGSEMRVPVSQLQHKIPGAGDTVIVFEGDFGGKRAEITSVDGQDGIVSLGADLQIIPVRWMVPIASSS